VVDSGFLQCKCGKGALWCDDVALRGPWIRAVFVVTNAMVNLGHRCLTALGLIMQWIAGDTISIVSASGPMDSEGALRQSAAAIPK